MAYKIFIGSSSESKDLAKRIAQELADSKAYEPIRWWEAFQEGESVYQGLQRIAANVDGAVFVLRADDKVWYRGKDHDVPRDNLTLEWGLFSAFLGPTRTVMVVDEHVKLPSDVSGIIYLPASSDPSTTAEKVVSALENALKGLRYKVGQRPLIYADPTLTKLVLDRSPPHDWHQRSVYRGTDGARAWLEVEQDVGYIPQSRLQSSDKLLRDALSSLPEPPRTFVSLGPGSGKLDRKMLAGLQIKSPGLQYVPVDISDGLLQEAISANLDSSQVPFGVLGDFEGRMSFIERILSELVGTPRLYVLIGNTFGNLDLGEEAFLGSLYPSFNDGCTLLLHVSLLGDDWTWERDPRTEVSRINPGYFRLLANALGVPNRNVRDADELLAIRDRINVSEGTSDVPDTVTIRYSDKRTNRTLYCIRRYRWDSLTDWVEKLGLKILYQGRTDVGGELENGVLLLTAGNSLKGFGKPKKG